MASDMSNLFSSGYMNEAFLKSGKAFSNESGYSEQIKVLPRDRIVARQAHVTTHATARNEYKIRSANHNPFYPVGDPKCFNLASGYLLFTITDDSYIQDNKDNLSPHSNLVFAVFNGLKAQRIPKVKFEGICKLNVETTGDSTPDTVVSVVRTGLETIINLSNKKVPAGATVYWVEPEYIVNPTNPDMKTPLYHILGTQNRSFFPSIAFIPSQGETMVAQSIAIEVFKHFDKFTNQLKVGYSNEDLGIIGSETLTRVSTAWQEKSISQQKQTCPLFAHAITRILILSIPFFVFEHRPNSTVQEISASFLNGLDDILSPYKEISIVYHEIRTLFEQTHARILDCKKSTAVINQQLISNILMQLTKYSEMQEKSFYKLMKDRYIGISTKTTDPGQPMEVLL
jgi:hypothetical protein